MTSYDVIVVGARVAGSATALLLDQLQASSKAPPLRASRSAPRYHRLRGPVRRA